MIRPRGFVANAAANSDCCCAVVDGDVLCPSHGWHSTQPARSTEVVRESG
jgi:hypothetical protein